MPSGTLTELALHLGLPRSTLRDHARNIRPISWRGRAAIYSLADLNRADPNTKAAVATRRRRSALTRLTRSVTLCAESVDLSADA